MVKPLGRKVLMGGATGKGNAIDGLFGLSSDFPNLREIDVAAIEPNPEQPRRYFDKDELKGLADSIALYGLKQPILVRELPEGRYRLIAGERRWRAHQLLGRKTIYAILNDDYDSEISLIENIQRADLTPLELARGLKQLQERTGATAEELAAKLGCRKPEVIRTLSLLRLPANILNEYEQDYLTKIPKAVLVEVASERDPIQQRNLWEQAKSGNTTQALRASKKRLCSEKKI